MLFLNYLGVFGPMRGLVEKWLVVPVKASVYTWQRRFHTDLNSCSLKNDKEAAELKAQIVSLQEENFQQRKLLSSPLPKNWQFLPVKVIGVDNEILTIAAGKRDGVSEGMVAVDGTTYLGKVTSVSENMAQISLPSYFEEKLVVKVASSSADPVVAKGLLIGRGQGSMRIDQILASELPAKGDVVLTSAEGGDLLVGEIEDVIVVQGEAFKTAQVKRLFNPEDLTTIFLVRGKI